MTAADELAQAAKDYRANQNTTPPPPPVREEPDPEARPT